MTAPDTPAGLTALAEEAALRLEQEARYLDVAEAAGDADTADYARDCLAVAALLRRLAAALADARAQGRREGLEEAEAAVHWAMQPSDGAIYTGDYARAAAMAAAAERGRDAIRALAQREPSA